MISRSWCWTLVRIVPGTRSSGVIVGRGVGTTWGRWCAPAFSTVVKSGVTPLSGPGFSTSGRVLAGLFWPTITQLVAVMCCSSGRGCR